jgi:hypothetical protein
MVVARPADDAVLHEAHGRVLDGARPIVSSTLDPQ